MVKRFFAIFFRNWTYEIKYSMEIIRLLVIQILFFLYICINPLVIKYLERTKLFLVWVPVMIFYMYANFFSFGRFIQIRQNKRYSKLVSPEQLKAIQKAYPNEKMYVYFENQYNCILPNSSFLPSDQVLLITIGRTQLFDKKKLKSILKDKEDNNGESGC